MIRILYGKVGTGKSTRIMEMIKKDCSEKKRSYLIVPEQKNLIAERQLASSTEPSCQLYTEATNFTRLANSVFRTVGGLNYNYVTKSGKSLIMYRALCEVRQSLKSYSIAKGRERGAVKAFLDAVGELKTYGVTAEDVLFVSDKIENEKLSARLKDLSLVKSVYERILYEKFSDPYDDILLLAKKLEEYPYFKDSNVYVDSFYGFTKAQWNVIMQIINQASTVTFALDMPADGEKSDYAKIGKTAEQIEKTARQMGVSLEKLSLTEDRQHTNKAIEYLCDNLWSFDAPSLKEYEKITLVTPQDEFDECEYVASKIRELVFNGASYSDIAVIMGKADDYDGIIDMMLEKYEIPMFFTKKTDVSAKPLVKMVMSAITILDSYKLQDVSDYMKCGYTDISLEKASELEGYMYRWGIQGKRKFEDDDFWGANPDGYVLEPTEAQISELQSVHETRAQIIDSLAPLKDAFEKKKPCKDILVSLYEFLESHKIKEKLDIEIKGASKEDAIETAQLYNGLIKALDTVYDVMGDEILDPETFLTVLRYALEGVKVGSIPTGEDKVTVGEASGIRAESIKHVFILGAVAGKFPADVTDDGFFSDRDKIELETHGITLSSMSDVRSADELLNFKNAIAAASESVCVSAPKSSLNGQTKYEKSIGFIRIEALLQGIRAESTLDMPLYDRIYTERVAREYLSFASSPTVSALSSVFGEKAEKISFSNDEITVDRDSIKELFPRSLNMTSSRIESFVLCHFKYYCDYLLKLRQSKKISFASDKVGNLAHAVFEGFLKMVKEDKLDIKALTEEEIKELADRMIDSYIDALCGGGRRSNRLNRLFDTLRRNIYVFLYSIARELSESKFTPEYFELPIGTGAGVGPGLRFKIGEGTTLTLTGICDRVDIFRKEKDTYIRVVDYKSGHKTLTKSDMELGLSLQLLIYLFSICKMEGCVFRSELEGAGTLLPAGALYFPLDIGRAKMKNEESIALDSASEKERESMDALIKRSGIFLDDIEILEAQDPRLKGEYIPKYPSLSKTEEVFVSAERFEEIFEQTEDTVRRIGEELLSGNAFAKPLERKGKKSPCEYCASRAVCRRRK